MVHAPEPRFVVDARWAFDRYEQLRDRLPHVVMAARPQRRADLSALAERFDAFVFDSFGVLNVGDTPIVGAAARVAALRKAGKQVFVLTNAATSPLSSLEHKYRSLGFDFTADEIVSSRAILASGLAQRPGRSCWLAVAPETADIGELGIDYRLLSEHLEPPDTVAGVIFMSSSTMTEALHARLSNVLRQRSLPVLIGNPDLVAPRDDGFSLEPGFYAHRLTDELGIKPEFFGKPYANAFVAIKRQLKSGIAHNRVAMIGDTLHTDILGGANAGFATVLVTGHGVLRDLDVDDCIARSGIVPDFIIPDI